MDVTVTTPGGTSATSSADQFTYVAAPTVSGMSPTAGPPAGGTLVTITGTGFTGATAVDFGTTAATNVTVVSDTTITADSPAGTGTVDVTVTTPGGTSATSPADQFTYATAPTVTGMSPTSGPAAGRHFGDDHRGEPRQCHGGPLRRRRREQFQERFSHADRAGQPGGQPGRWT